MSKVKVYKLVLPGECLGTESTWGHCVLLWLWTCKVRSSSERGGQGTGCLEAGGEGRGTAHDFTCTVAFKSARAGHRPVVGSSVDIGPRVQTVIACAFLMGTVTIQTSRLNVFPF